MKIHEYQGKEIFRNFSIPTPKGYLIEDIDEAAIQAKVKEVEEAMHSVSAKLYEAASAEMAQQDGSGEDGDIDVGGDDVVDADFEVVEEDED